MKQTPRPSSPKTPDLFSELPRVFHNAYPCLVRGKWSELAKNRDAAAFVELMAGLTRRGYVFESIIFNYALADGTAVKEQAIAIRSGDLIVMVTRPPLHDASAGNRRYVPRSGTRLEASIFDSVSRHLGVCSRVRLRLSEEIVSEWERAQTRTRPGESPQTPADFEFSLNCDARLKLWKTLEPGSRAHRIDYGPDYRSIGCFLHLPRIEEFGCRLIVSFGMGSLENLIWNRIVRTRFDRWLDRPVVAIAEMDLNGIPRDPVTLHFAENVPVKVLLEVPIEDEAGAEAIAA
jgi:hypothetical protein